MAEVTVYNRTKHEIVGLYHGAPYRIPASAGDVVGQIVVSEKHAKVLLADQDGKVTLNRGDIAGTVNNVADLLRAENKELKEKVAFLENQLEKIKQGYAAEKKEAKK